MLNYKETLRPNLDGKMEIEMQNTSSQRRFCRSPYAGSVALWRQRQPELVKADDLSEGGVFIGSTEPENEGTLLTLRLSLPGKKGFTVLGRVVRNR